MTVPQHAHWLSAELDGEPIAAVLSTGNPFHFALPANPSTSEQILSFKPAKDSGGANLAELGKTHMKFSDLGSLGGDDEAPQPKESTLAQAFLSVISSVLPAPEKSMLDSCGQPCSIIPSSQLAEAPSKFRRVVALQLIEKDVVVEIGPQSFEIVRDNCDDENELHVSLLSLVTDSTLSALHYTVLLHVILMRDQVLIDLIDPYRFNQTKLLQLLTTTIKDELPALGLELNESKPFSGKTTLSSQSLESSITPESTGEKQREYANDLCGKGSVAETPSFACLANSPKATKESQQRRGCDARHRVTLRLLTTWFDILWVKMEAIETMIALTLDTLIPVIGASGFAAAVSVAGTVAGSVTIAASFGAAGAGLTGSQMVLEGRRFNRGKISSSPSLDQP
ncbi:hypothetical protein Nepgr_003638 [Nepenthes gracilis]|uniref:Uncharacterized protein n=1 Tax=Nepenthes gracilis TaxID=150966 RepID=A0AAD3XDX3_NEPGR|nr:hypothetical protein Nepgr_003638 [Nepenthes gracilis]